VEHDDAFAAGVPFVLKEVGEDQPASGFDDVGEELAAEALLLSPSPVAEVEEDRIEAVEVDTIGTPTGAEITRLLGRDEAPVEPDPPAFPSGQATSARIEHRHGHDHNIIIVERQFMRSPAADQSRRRCERLRTQDRGDAVLTN
jgi:hypothetical protein